MASRVVKILNPKQFHDCLNGVPVNKLIVVDFFAEWCGPCKIISPKLEEFSRKYLHVSFLKVNVDERPEIAAKYGIEAMPTFIFIRNKAKIDLVRGADATKLESTILKWMGPASEMEADPQRVCLGQSFPCFDDLVSNNAESFDTAAGIIVRYANNILKDPDNLKYRQIKLGNEVFMNKLLPILGAVDCLFTMGFEEMNDKLLLAPGSSLENLHALRDALVDEIRKIKNKTPSVTNQAPKDEETEKPTSLSPSCTSGQLGVMNIDDAAKTIKYEADMRTGGEIQFFNSIKSSTNQVLLYEEETLQEYARSKIPLEKLTDEAKKKSATIADAGSNATVSERDCLLLQLLSWFKNDFFTWMNSPKCDGCNENTKGVGTVEPTVDDLMWGASMVEAYQCPKCSANFRFPRYNHPRKLLDSKTGRCGEWANCFTLCCRAVGFEARYVLDSTDHVWTEVYSDSQKRWLHCDACENICDKPLVYECGWGKQLSYIIAFSRDQVIDVTWRYSQNHVDVIKRRKKVSESWLLNVCEKITDELQQNMAEDRKKVMISRFTIEIVEFITQKKDVDGAEQEGRISGSLAWRQLRGETTGISSTLKNFKFEPTAENIEKKRLRIRYNPVKDCYYTSLDDAISADTTSINGWENCVEESRNMYKKEEHDWKMLYLARNMGTDSASLTWCIDLSATNLTVDIIHFKLEGKTYENGCIQLSLDGDSYKETFDANNGAEYMTSVVSGSKIVRFTVNLSGGKGDVAWQHAQLFRCPLSQSDFIGLDLDISLQ